MDLLSKTLRMIAALVMALVVAGFMLAFINSDTHEFFLAIYVAPIALVFFGASALLDPHRHPDSI
jgi:predicted Co/Zn/Cd cation transporter (cation efflux family)